ncbi:transposase [Arthrobacter stackebrandtii]|uniref:transposase n=1 Tax=Arthrobacter stackebrandtii TaxID=272161 RepID=UPI000D9B588C|nr:hypothetical protein CVV67_10860 [Arthrobacter stackebrandtii]
MLVPPSLQEWLPEGHLARFIVGLVENELDLTLFCKSYAKAKGQPPNDPRLMLRILLHGYCTGVHSSRAIKRACTDVVSFRWLSAQQGPDLRSMPLSMNATRCLRERVSAGPGTVPDRGHGGAGQGRPGREEGTSERFQAQDDVLRPDNGEAEGLGPANQ